MTTPARFLPVLLFLSFAALPSIAAETSSCAPGVLVLWGDGEHDDTAGLNAWFRGEPVVWAGTREDVGAVIDGRHFLLTEAIYTPGGTGRTLEHFTLSWPARHETVSGDLLATGIDPNRPPTQVGLRIVGGDDGEGVAFELPDAVSEKPGISDKCLTS